MNPPRPAAAHADAKLHLRRILDTLEAHYGLLTPDWPTDPYLFLLWWHCGYPPSEERCARGWQALQDSVGVAPEKILAAAQARLARALKSGGMVPELRATRIKTVARAVREEHGGGLRAALAELPWQKARSALRGFPGIGAPGADRILLFARLAPLAAVPSACPQVLPRIADGNEPQGYQASYARAQGILEAQLPTEFAARERAYLLLQRHGRELCKRSNPRCDRCPVVRVCAYGARRG